MCDYSRRHRNDNGEIMEKVWVIEDVLDEVEENESKSRKINKIF